MASVITVGPSSSSSNENARALLSLEFSKEFLKPELKLNDLSVVELKSMFETACTRSNAVFKEIKPLHHLSETELLGRYPTAGIMHGDLPDAMDTLLGHIALKSTSGIVTCVVLIQTTYDSPWSRSLCIVCNAELSYYSVFDPTSGTITACKNVDVDVRSVLEKEAGIYFRAAFIHATHVDAAATVEVKKTKPAATRKRAAPSTAPTAAAQPDEKKAVPSSPPPPPPPPAASVSAIKKDE